MGFLLNVQLTGSETHTHTHTYQRECQACFLTWTRRVATTELKVTEGVSWGKYKFSLDTLTLRCVLASFMST